MKGRDLVGDELRFVVLGDPGVTGDRLARPSSLNNFLDIDVSKLFPMTAFAASRIVWVER